MTYKLETKKPGFGMIIGEYNEEGRCINMYKRVNKYNYLYYDDNLKGWTIYVCERRNVYDTEKYYFKTDETGIITVCEDCIVEEMFGKKR